MFQALNIPGWTEIIGRTFGGPTRDEVAALLNRWPGLVRRHQQARRAVERTRGIYTAMPPTVRRSWENLVTAVVEWDDQVIDVWTPIIQRAANKAIADRRVRAGDVPRWIYGDQRSTATNAAPQMQGLGAIVVPVLAAAAVLAIIAAIIIQAVERERLRTAYQAANDRTSAEYLANVDRHELAVNQWFERERAAGNISPSASSPPVLIPGVLAAGAPGSSLAPVAAGFGVGAAAVALGILYLVTRKRSAA
jgi:hypothetical protein